MLSDFDIDKFLAGKPLAITVAGLEELRAHVLARLMMFDAQPSATLEAMVAAATERSAQSSKTNGATGIIPIRGTISQHAKGDISGFAVGGAATDEIAAALDTLLADDAVSKIILDIDSPGGTSYGVTELAQKIYDSRGQKPIIAVANSLAASAAYWIGASADRFYITPGGIVGSIGVYAIHQDVSKMAEDLGVKTTLISAGKYKTLGNQFEPLNEEALAHIQARVDDVYGQFLADVARGRGVAASVVRGGYGEGDVLTAKAAKAEGMVDGVMTFDAVVARTFRIAPSGAGVRAEIETPDLEADNETPTPQEDEEANERLARMRLRSFQARAAANAV